VNNHDSNTLLSSLDHAVDILGTHRTADPAMIATFDTLKQARAMVRQLVERGLLADAPGTSASPAELRAA
jgi:hypothetical protein